MGRYSKKGSVFTCFVLLLFFLINNGLSLCLSDFANALVDGCILMGHNRFKLICGRALLESTCFWNCLPLRWLRCFLQGAQLWEVFSSAWTIFTQEFLNMLLRNQTSLFYAKLIFRIIFETTNKVFLIIIKKRGNVVLSWPYWIIFKMLRQILVIIRVSRNWRFTTTLFKQFWWTNRELSWIHRE